MNSVLQKKLAGLPHQPGVYVYKDARGDVLYVGKAKDLAKRVRSYWQSGRSLVPDKALMVSQAADIDITVVSSETEAFLLEASFIKKYRPRFNIILKDDKSFSYIKVTLREEFPRVLVVRRVTRDGSRYFGPFLSSAVVYETLGVLRKLFPYRTCDVMPKRPCLEYHMGRCIAPCAFESGRAEYGRVIADVLAFLSGDTRAVVRDLRAKMAAAAVAREFEKAARFRDQIAAVARVTEKQHIVSVAGAHQDVVSVVKVDGVAGVNVFTVRDGEIRGKANFILQHTEHADEAAIVQAFLQQYYTQVMDLPREIIVPVAVLLPQLDVLVTVPQRGHKRQLLLMGEKNAAQYVEQSRVSWEREEHRARRGLRELGEAVGVPGVDGAGPQRVEVYDISNIQGYEAVGSMVVFVGVMPAKAEYRKFKIRELKTPNDFAMLQEVMYRRMQHVKDWPRPDLLIIDGGKGQLSSVKKVLDELRVDVPVVSLAKREEELFVPGRAESVRLPKDSQGLFLVQRMRDEAHRFAIGFYRKRHEKAQVKSALDEVPAFGSAAGVRAASDEALERLVGKKLVATIREFL